MASSVAQAPDRAAVAGARPMVDLRPRNARQVPRPSAGRPAQPGHRAGVEAEAGDRQIGQRHLLYRWQNGPIHPACAVPGGPGRARQPPRRAGMTWPAQTRGESPRRLPLPSRTPCGR